jgi:ADP-ribose pyrophosphatase YjhB (NUDIX family)
MNESPELEHGKTIGSPEHTRTIPTKRTAASVLFTNTEGHVLLCQPTYKEVAEPPGGAGEENESPRDTATREVQEELGLIITPGRLIAVDYVPATNSGRTEGIIFVFDGGPLTPEQTNEITLDHHEIESWAWCPVEEIHTRMRPIVARRITASLTAITTNAFLYLENGHPIGEPSREHVENT